LSLNGLWQDFGFSSSCDCHSDEDSSFIEDEEREGSISATDLFAEIDDFDDIITDDSDNSDDDGYLPQVSDNRARFPSFAQEAKDGFSLQARPKTFRKRL